MCNYHVRYPVHPLTYTFFLYILNIVVFLIPKGSHGMQNIYQGLISTNIKQEIFL